MKRLIHSARIVSVLMEKCFRRITSLSCSINLSCGLGMSPPRGLDAFSLQIYDPISFKNTYGHPL
jgi:hypothetical protein